MNLFDTDRFTSLRVYRDGLALLPSRFAALPANLSALQGPVLGFVLFGALTLSVMITHYMRDIPVSAESQAVLSLHDAADKKPAAAAHAPHGPSVFERESAMSPRDLLDRWNPLIEAAAKRFNVPKDWIRAVMIQESGGRTMLTETRKWISDKGALGLMQLMPDTYAELRAQYALGADPFNPKDNIEAGAAYLRWLHDKYGMSGMFAAYNAGPARLEQSLASNAALPDETQFYVRGVARSLGFDQDMLMPPNLRIAAQVHDTNIELAMATPVAVVPQAIVQPAAVQNLQTDDGTGDWSSQIHVSHMSCPYAAMMGCDQR